MILIIRKLLFSQIIFFSCHKFLKKFGAAVSVVVAFIICILLETGLYINSFGPAGLGRTIGGLKVLDSAVLQWLWGGEYFDRFILLYYLGAWFFLLLLFIMGTDHLGKERSGEIHIQAFQSKKIVSAFGLFFAGLIFVLSAGSNIIDVAHYTVSIEGLPPELHGFKIVQVSDLHNTIYPEGQQSLIDKILAEDGDLILLTGDIADDRANFMGTRLLMEGITGVAPIFYVTGNHEFWSHTYRQDNAEIKAYGVITLEDAYLKFEYRGRQIFIAGLDDPYSFAQKPGNTGLADRIERIDQIARGEDADLKILLSHRPEYARYYGDTDFDLVFSGHAHGGQIRIPLTGIGLYAPHQGWFPKYTSGVYELSNKTRLIVSRGLSYGEGLPRIFNRPHLVVVTLLE